MLKKISYSEGNQDNVLTHLHYIWESQEQVSKHISHMLFYLQNSLIQLLE